MDYRHVISFGKSSYVLSLPKSWVRAQNIAKGDILTITEQGNNLLLTPRKINKESAQEKTITINVDNKTPTQIKREIIPAYINNTKTILIEGKELASKTQAIQAIIHNLMALEVISIEPERITAKDFLNMNEITLPQLIKKMDTITRAMISDLATMFSEDTCENVLQRDADVNRLSYLIYRAIRYAAAHNTTTLFETNTTDLFNAWTLTHFIERIADEAKRTARQLKLLKLPKKLQPQIIILTQTLCKNYEDMMDAYYTKNKELAHRVTARKEEALAAIDAVSEAGVKHKNLPTLTERLKGLAMATHELGRVVYE